MSSLLKSMLNCQSLDFAWYITAHWSLGIYTLNAHAIMYIQWKLSQFDLVLPVAVVNAFPLFDKGFDAMKFDNTGFYLIAAN